MTIAAVSDNTMFQHLSMGQVYSRTASLFADRLDVYMSLSAVVLAPTVLMIASIAFAAGLDKVMNDKMAQNSIDGSDGMTDFLQQHAGSVMFIYIVEMVLMVTIFLLGEGGIVRAAADAYAEQPQGWFACLKLAMQSFWSLLGASFLIMIPLMVGVWVVFNAFVFAIVRSSGFGFLVAVLLGIGFLVVVCYYAGAVLLVFPVVLVEQKGPIRSLERCMELSQGRRCYIFCALFVLWIFKLILGQLLQNIFGGNHKEIDGPAALIWTLLSPKGLILAFLPALLHMPLSSIMKLVLYCSVRVDKEGLTRDVLQRELVAPAAYAAPAARNTDYRQVALMDGDGKDTLTNSLVSDFA